MATGLPSRTCRTFDALRLDVGLEHTYDNRYLWMNLKRIIGSHFANFREAAEANRLVVTGKIHPTLSTVYPLADAGQAALDVHTSR